MDDKKVKELGDGEDIDEADENRISKRKLGDIYKDEKTAVEDDRTKIEIDNICDKVLGHYIEM